MQFDSRLKARLAKTAGLIVLVCALASCTSIYRKHGYIPAQQQLDDIVVGVDTTETVASAVGRPSGTGVLKDGDWYFVQSNWRHYGYRQPEEIDRQVVAIRFDSRGVVSNVERFGLENGRVVALSRRMTDSNIQGVSFLNQMFSSFGNLGASALGAVPGQ
ncbi:outer membrane protein assembly factor BamE [Falsihalocynthiibacter sp. SS001]|uniref:outer membrane protein assembly factor BamE n=1 Tax=Falsihalocynthiibacter sp. SS001 TaxID=3349698 RepID=UPI0036D37714